MKNRICLRLFEQENVFHDLSAATAAAAVVVCMENEHASSLGTRPAANAMYSNKIENRKILAEILLFARRHTYTYRRSN